MTVDDRPRGILSPADRQYLRDPDEYSKQAGYERRRAIVERLHEALHDMPLLVSELDEDLRTEAFEDGDLDGKDHTINVLHSAFALLYLGITDTVEPEELGKDAFEDLVGQGVKRAYQERGEPVANVEVSVDVTRAESDKPIEDMSIGEMTALARAGELDREQVIQEMAEKLPADEHSSLSSDEEVAESRAEWLSDMLIPEEDTGEDESR
jgi:DNA-binding transcriptional ArsR family regulator